MEGHNNGSLTTTTCYQYHVIKSLSIYCPPVFFLSVRKISVLVLLFFPEKQLIEALFICSLLCFNRKSFIWLDLGFTCVSFVTGALAFWAPKFLLYASRTQGLTDATESE